MVGANTIEYYGVGRPPQYHATCYVLYFFVHFCDGIVIVNWRENGSEPYVLSVPLATYGYDEEVHVPAGISSLFNAQDCISYRPTSNQ